MDIGTVLGILEFFYMAVRNYSEFRVLCGQSADLYIHSIDDRFPPHSNVICT